MISVTSKTTKRLADEAPSLTARLEKVVSHGMQIIRKNALARQSENYSNATGNLRRSIIAGAETHGRDVVGYLNMPNYWANVEHGTGPHRPPIVTPEGGGLLRWVIAKRLVRGADKWVKLADSGIGPNGKALSPRAHARAREIANQVAPFAQQFKGKRMPNGRLAEAMTMGIERARAISSDPMASAKLRRAASTRIGIGEGHAKGLNALEKAEISLAWAVADAISKRGTKARPFVGPGVVAALPRVVRDVQAVLGGRQ